MKLMFKAKHKNREVKVPELKISHVVDFAPRKWDFYKAFRNKIKFSTLNIDKLPAGYRLVEDSFLTTIEIDSNLL